MLSVEQAQDRAADIIARARAAGADAADAIYAADMSLDVAVRLGSLEDVSRSENAELGLRVFVGQRSASVSTSDLSASATTALVERAIAMAREAPEDQWAGLAPEAMLLRAAPPALDLDDGGPDGDNGVSPAELRALAEMAEAAARAVPGVTNSEGGGASAARGIMALATSHGFAAGYATSGYGVHASVLAGGENGAAMARDYAHHGTRHRADLESAEAIGTRAGERAAARANPGTVESGSMPVIFDPRIGGSLIGHLAGAISGQSITRKTSFLLDALGTRILPEGVTIHDDPLRPRGLRSRPFDGEGLPVAAHDIVADGVLTTWLLDSASARQLGLAPTGHAARGGAGSPGISTTNMHMAPGTISRDAMIGSVSRGIYVTELIGMGVNGVTGDYSRGAAGFLIENGEITRPVAEFTIAGNLKDMFLHLTPADDLVFRYGTNVPTIMIEGMTIAGD